ncbi:imidazole glycerol phosphate synthase subunit HisH [Paenisporosarcina cavernae]|uniref:Imidazole glycerol phosphate synthase subunit HisH n=1 Tax=Paenisporosarcina cavernae TaxID=2320858 RepID=A0A385YSN7_9BACL|nr:imidazole glycerol phosphate synthase subunit HisH [Paenisporosarcina cavernae]AYC28453.1 imidazole glycerol phosphate synthase subunit HisH [Paenisporosarcina cavernae]
MIGIIDYGMGNLFSVAKALERIGVKYVVTDDQRVLQEMDGLILPGVGSFKDAMSLLNKTGLTETVHAYVASGKPLLGICLGMQLLFESSEENGQTEGLNLLPGHVKKFSGKTKNGEFFKVPHMGWNKLSFRHKSPIFDGISEDYVYFVHSYYVETDMPDVVLASCTYEDVVPAIVGRDNVWGMQFHPEKSGDVGMQLLTNFTNFVEKGGV